MIYFIQQGETGPITIGSAKAKIVYRLQRLDLTSPVKLRLLGVIREEEEGITYDLVKAKFHDYLIRKDWYSPDEKLTKFIGKHARQLNIQEDQAGKVIWVDQVILDYINVHKQEKDSPSEVLKRGLGINNGKEDTKCP